MQLNTKSFRFCHCSRWWSLPFSVAATSGAEIAVILFGAIPSGVWLKSPTWIIALSNGRPFSECWLSPPSKRPLSSTLRPVSSVSQNKLSSVSQFVSPSLRRWPVPSGDTALPLSCNCAQALSGRRFHTSGDGGSGKPEVQPNGSVTTGWKAFPSSMLFLFARDVQNASGLKKEKTATNEFNSPSS